MANLKDIRTRINSVKKTQKTTNAMKMVSAAKLRRAQDAIEQALPYANQLQAVVGQLSQRFSEEEHVFFRKNDGMRVAVILITSDRGLCGGFNTNLCKAVARYLEAEQIEQAEFTIIGRKGRDFFKNTSHTIAKAYSDEMTQSPRQVMEEVMTHYAKQFEEQQVDKVLLAHNHFVSALTQDARINTLLPITPPAHAAESADERDVIFEPSAEVILGTLLEKYLENQMNTGWLDSIAGEHGARMTAMDSATKNAGEMIDKLQLFYNRTRQAAITRELIEIISGAESL